jgi:hypothetical protein
LRRTGFVCHSLKRLNGDDRPPAAHHRQRVI